MSSRKGYEEDKQNISSAMFLAAPYDKASEAWTSISPNLLVSTCIEKHLSVDLYFVLTQIYYTLLKEQKRLVAYARSSANVLSKLVSQEHSDSVQWEVSE